MPKEKILKELGYYCPEKGGNKGGCLLSAGHCYWCGRKEGEIKLLEKISKSLDLYAKEKLRESNKHLEEVISRRIKKLNYTLAERQIENKDTKDIEIVIKELENIIKQIISNNEKDNSNK